MNIFESQPFLAEVIDLVDYRLRNLRSNIVELDASVEYFEVVEAAKPPKDAAVAVPEYQRENVEAGPKPESVIAPAEAETEAPTPELTPEELQRQLEERSRREIEGAFSQQNRRAA